MESVGEGNYTVFAVREGDENYNDAVNTTTFKSVIMKAISLSTVPVINSIHYVKLSLMLQMKTSFM